MGKPEVISGDNKKIITKKIKTGRPSTIEKINWKEFDKLCSYQSTEEEIANWFNCSVDTIERAVKKCKNMSFAEYFSQKRSKGKISLRRKQMQLALEGDRTLLIWLGKQYLGQVEKVEHTGESGKSIIIELRGATLKNLPK